MSTPAIAPAVASPSTPAEEWPKKTTSAIVSETSEQGQPVNSPPPPQSEMTASDSTGPLTPIEKKVPGAYPATPHSETAPQPLQQQSTVGGGILETAKSYVPTREGMGQAIQSATETVKQYLPEAVTGSGQVKSAVEGVSPLVDAPPPAKNLVGEGEGSEMMDTGSETANRTGEGGVDSVRVEEIPAEPAVDKSTEIETEQKQDEESKLPLEQETTVPSSVVRQGEDILNSLEKRLLIHIIGGETLQDNTGGYTCDCMLPGHPTPDMMKWLIEGRLLGDAIRAQEAQLSADQGVEDKEAKDELPVEKTTENIASTRAETINETIKSGPESLDSPPTAELLASDQKIKSEMESSLPITSTDADNGEPRRSSMGQYVIIPHRLENIQEKTRDNRLGPAVTPPSPTPDVTESELSSGGVFSRLRRFSAGAAMQRPRSRSRSEAECVPASAKTVPMSQTLSEETKDLDEDVGVDAGAGPGIGHESPGKSPKRVGFMKRIKGDVKVMIGEIQHDKAKIEEGKRLKGEL
ncbi:hypothetical protein AMATHDRAFT_6540 [Amanita thiersii Skay4041]|uniref:Uncharacterized protein n=1 Tax=Amanita thiersii Skay4041 TaxID=703135 RepID=A0A2A9NHA9_9AGAR|nr:hypothetical protein AMATHDRAFT_6540 [Amanita thiersii Skay4041]